MRVEKIIQVIIGYWLPPIIFTGFIFFLSTRPYFRSDFPDLVDLVLRKIAHMAEYFILTILLARVGLRESKGFLKRFAAILIAGAGALMTAIFDEHIQTFVFGREGCLRDVFIDGIGVTLAIFVIIWYINLRFRSFVNK